MFCKKFCIIKKSYLLINDQFFQIFKFQNWKKNWVYHLVFHINITLMMTLGEIYCYLKNYWVFNIRVTIPIDIERDCIKIKASNFRRNQLFYINKSNIKSTESCIKYLPK